MTAKVYLDDIMHFIDSEYGSLGTECKFYSNNRDGF